VQRPRGGEAGGTGSDDENVSVETGHTRHGSRTSASAALAEQWTVSAQMSAARPAAVSCSDSARERP
jgi:hypothetical protein